MGNTLSNLGEELSSAFDKIWEQVKQVAGKIIQFIEELIEKIKEFLKAVFSLIGQFVDMTLASFADILSEFLSGNLSKEAAIAQACKAAAVNCQKLWPDLNEKLGMFKTNATAAIESTNNTGSAVDKSQILTTFQTEVAGYQAEMNAKIDQFSKSMISAVDTTA